MDHTPNLGLSKPETTDAATALRIAIGDNADTLETYVSRYIASSNALHDVADVSGTAAAFTDSFPDVTVPHAGTYWVEVGWSATVNSRDPHPMTVETRVILVGPGTEVINGGATRDRAMESYGGVHPSISGNAAGLWVATGSNLTIRMQRAVSMPTGAGSLRFTHRRLTVVAVPA